MKKVRQLAWIALTWGIAALGFSEVIYLENGDVVHGELVAANNTEITLKTAYGKLVIPKKDIERIDYQDSPPPKASAPATEAKDVSASRRPVSGDRAVISLNITGRSFWYAFESSDDNAADTRIRLRLYVGSARACTFEDEKPDTVDGGTLYNSFTFSPTDSLLIETLEGFECSVDKSEDGDVHLRIDLPPESSTGRQLIRMLYEVNEGDRSFPSWANVVSRSFSVEVEPGKETAVILEQDASAVEYTGFFKKRMKNLELFQLTVIGTELKD